MGVNKIKINTGEGEQVLIDLSGDNVVADSLVIGHTAHGADGELVNGANPYEMEATNAEVGTQADLIAQIAQALEGKASGGGGGLAFDMGEFVLDADVTNVPTRDGITHNLGSVPGVVVIWTDDFADLSAENVSPYANTTQIGYVWMDGLTGMEQRLTSAIHEERGIFATMTVKKADYAVAFSTPTSKAYSLLQNNGSYLPTAEKFSLPYQGPQVWWRAGVTYRYFVSKAWWDVGGVANAE